MIETLVGLGLMLAFIVVLLLLLWAEDKGYLRHVQTFFWWVFSLIILGAVAHSIGASVVALFRG